MYYTGPVTSLNCQRIAIVVTLLLGSAVPGICSFTVWQSPVSPPPSTRSLDNNCVSCQHENRPGAKFCSNCGAKLQTGCSNCGAGAASGDRYCIECGADLRVERATPPPEPVREPVAASPPEMEEVQPTYPSFKMGGFSDLTFAGPGRTGPNGFNVGQFILHVNSALAPKVQFFSELSLTARGDVGTGAPPATAFNADVERVVLRLDHSDQLRFSVGRYHTPINWWNTAFHHGQWLQTSISRPEMTRFGGNFIPVHFVGGLIEGSVPARGLNLNYNLGLGNGRGAVVSRGGDAGDVNNNLSWLFNTFIKPRQLYGLQVGGSVYRDRITLANGANFREWIISGHAIWNREDPEIIAEYAHINHEQFGGANMNSQAYYIQAAYRLPILNKKFKPYYRYERIRLPLGDPILAGVPGLQGSTFGVRYDLSDFVALKTEYRNHQRAGLPNLSGFFGQMSFAF